MHHRMGEEAQVLGMLRNVKKEKSLSLRTKMGI